MNSYERWMNAKDAEKSATAERIDAEKAILAIHPAKDEGQETFNEYEFKITIKQEVKRTLDEKAWALVMHKIPEAVRPVEEVKTLKLDVKGYKWLHEKEPALFKIMTTCVTEKPSKPSITIERT